tara:strand:+ start:4172 stop:4543 length:372 start_codon:yes stop_codon:yes gene_type:complete
MTIEERINRDKNPTSFFLMSSRNFEGAYFMPNTPPSVNTPAPTKKRRVMDYLASGRTLTPSQARSRFGVGNMRATISNIKSQVEAYGNWEVVTNPTATGLTSYGMEFHGGEDNPFAVRAGIID